MRYFDAEGEADKSDVELEKIFTTILPVCRACQSDDGWMPKSRVDMPYVTRHNDLLKFRAHRKAKRDAHAAVTELHPPQEDIVQVIAPEALEVQLSLEEMETTASTSRFGIGGGRGINVARVRSTEGRVR